MKIGVMPGNQIPANELRAQGFEALQMFFGGGADGDAHDPSPEKVGETLAAGNLALAAMTLHVGLVGPAGRVRGRRAARRALRATGGGPGWALRR